MIIALVAYNDNAWTPPVAIGSTHEEAISLVDSWLASRNPDTDEMPEVVSYWKRDDKGQFYQIDRAMIG